MRMPLNDELKSVLEACQKVMKSEDGEFSYKWLKLAGAKFPASAMTKLVGYGYLKINFNGILRQGTAWYRLAEGV